MKTFLIFHLFCPCVEVPFPSQPPDFLSFFSLLQNFFANQIVFRLDTACRTVRRTILPQDFGYSAFSTRPLPDA
ncbi:MAG: hypothetical protein AVDCRST_MAG56-1131 [uncultured Cytophagales bacterium]|uniref:Uncharacterized protein n=1 Tax=uncultured Cytophagales bacterium TaxID=158755 RepID=A0A6J4HVU7_9SPHI|nr:MAG: hypothetical protein AVDCRST_MAG56-1131 [uncultured Cytophagales bacterium]